MKLLCLLRVKKNILAIGTIWKYIDTKKYNSDNSDEIEVLRSKEHTECDPIELCLSSSLKISIVSIPMNESFVVV
ncbi:CLUMA_CG005985, isoform A [Clunio marinus]|uniref:CLUMA_CG005985, isoform A n=1 Tax=Clunio marinus TaxID=568069 RepID=A0A1J1HYK8_9DIPT|nr:CLUMA_CG005985, isoform A [Clunio marinus]